jgi:hypothetical protein
MTRAGDELAIRVRALIEARKLIGFHLQVRKVASTESHAKPRTVIALEFLIDYQQGQS